MNKTPIKIPRKIPHSKFAIPVPEGINHREAIKSFSLYGEMLKKLGFEKNIETKSISHESIHSGYSSDIKNYQVWTHPAGILLTVDSYLSPGYKDFNGIQRPARKSIGSAQVTAIVDVGVGPEIQMRASSEIGRSGHSDLMFDGNRLRYVYQTFNTNTNSQETLTKFLQDIQENGRVLPFEDWGRYGGIDIIKFNIPREVIVPIRKAEHGANLEEALREGYSPDLIGQVCAKLPEALGRHIMSEIKTSNPENRKDHGVMRWGPLELMIEEFSEAMFLAKKRWPKHEESALLELWGEVARQDHGEKLNIEAMRAYEVGPAGLSLPTALLYAKRQHPDTAAALLDELLETAPLDVLERWATQPDAAGYTLALRAIARHLVDPIVDNQRAPDVDVLSILYRRLGPEGICLATPKRSVLGLLLKERPEEKNDQTHSSFISIIEKLEGWGMPWNEHLRWRSYPNLYEKSEDRPAFFSIDGPVDPGQWTELLGARMSPHLYRVVSLLEQKSLELQTPEVALSTRNSMRL